MLLGTSRPLLPHLRTHIFRRRSPYLCNGLGLWFAWRRYRRNHNYIIDYMQDHITTKLVNYWYQLPAPLQVTIYDRKWKHKMIYPTLACEFQDLRVWGKFVFRTLELTDTPTNLANQVKVGHAFDQNNEPSWRSSGTDRRIRDSFVTINWLCLLFGCGIKTKTHFEWLLWHWSSLGQLNLEPTRPNGFEVFKVPTDLVKISVKEAKHIGFY